MLLILSSVRIGHLPFTRKPNSPKGLGRVRPDDIFQDGGEELQIESTFSKIFRSVERDLSYHLHSDRNLRNFCLNGKQRDVVIFNTLPMSCTRCSWEELDQTFDLANLEDYF